jgi:TfoX/Sxy family transcriptional regulator of competence genes
MAYDEALAERVRAQLHSQPGLTEKKMFGGLGFMVDGTMAVGVRGDELLVRVGAERMDDALAQPHTRESHMGRHVMKGFVLVSQDADLAPWVQKGVEYARSL